MIAQRRWSSNVFVVEHSGMLLGPIKEFVCSGWRPMQRGAEWVGIQITSSEDLYYSPPPPNKAHTHTHTHTHTKGNPHQIQWKLICCVWQLLHLYDVSQSQQHVYTRHGSSDNSFQNVETWRAINTMYNYGRRRLVNQKLAILTSGRSSRTDDWPSSFLRCPQSCWWLFWHFRWCSQSPHFSSGHKS